MKVTQPIQRESSNNGKGSVKNPEIECHKWYLSMKPIDWNKDVDTTVKSKETLKKGKAPIFKDTMYLLSGNKPLEKFIYWQKYIRDKLVTNKPKWDHV